MRVTFIANRFRLTTGGGSHRSLDLLASQLTRLGHKVSVVVLNSAGLEAPDDLPYRVINTTWVDCPRLVRIQRTRAVLQRYAPDTDVFHLYGPQLALGGGLYRLRQGGVPVVVTLNGYSLFCTNMDRMDGRCHRDCDLLKRLLHAPIPWRKRALGLPGRLYEASFGFKHAQYVDRYLPVSPPVGQIYSEAGFDMRTSTVISDVVDYDHLVASRPRLEPRPRPDPHEPWNLLFVGRLIPAKGVDILIDALSMLERPAHLHIAGDGPLRGALGQRVQALGVESRVTFHGWVPNANLWQLQNQTHAFVHPGRWPDPCPRAVLEAMAAGVPTIVSRVGGPPWMLRDFGHSFEPDDPADLARTIDVAFTTYERTQELAAGARARAAEFDYRRVTPQLEQVYREVLQRSS